ncbi:MAG: hypothetical protein NTW93_00025 [Phycisphaerae bacterium]|nr:hypothetical protein [Phycisphaerae bacterium]
MVKRIAILGSTGSIGRNALRVIEALGADYQVIALSAHNNVKLLAEQVKKFKPKVAVITNPEKFDEFKALAGGGKTEILCGEKGLVEHIRLRCI